MVVGAGKEPMCEEKFTNPREGQGNTAAIVPQMVEKDGWLEP